MLDWLMGPSSIEAIGLTILQRQWFARHGRWRGRIGDVVLHLPGTPMKPEIDAIETAKRVLAALQADLAPLIAALEQEAAQAGGVSAAAPRWRELVVWPYGREPGGAMALFEVSWDPEHAWGVWVEEDGRVKEVVVSP